MNELLEVKRRELELVNHYFSDSGSYTEIVPETATSMYDQLLKLHTTIRVCQDAAKLNFVEIGRCLAEIERDKLYYCVACGPGRRDGYSNFYKFCEGVFGFKKTTVVNLLKVYRAFCNQTDGQLSVEYINYSYCQLVELSSVEKYRERIPATCSSRDIKRLRELYKTYTPPQGTSFKDDLEEYGRRHKAELAEQNASRNKLCFQPAPKAPSPTAVAEPAAEEKEDVREVVTENAAPTLYTSDVIEGLLAQLELLRKSSEGAQWEKAIGIMQDAFRNREPKLIRGYIEVSELKTEIAKLKKATWSSTENIMRGKLGLKNREERKNWLLHLLDDKTILPWVDLSSVGCKLYRYDFENGASLIFAVYSSSERHQCYGYDIIENGKAWFMNGFSESQLVDWMTSHAKEI